MSAETAASWTDLRALQRDVLVAIRSLDEPRMADLVSQLGEWYAEEPACVTVHQNVSDLNEDGLVDSYNDQDDGRIVRYQLTHDGEAVVDQEARFLAREAGLDVVATDGAGGTYDVDGEAAVVDASPRQLGTRDVDDLLEAALQEADDQQVRQKIRRAMMARVAAREAPEQYLDWLNPTMRADYVACEIQGETHADRAEARGVTQPTVSSNVKRAKRRLGEIAAERGGDRDE